MKLTLRPQPRTKGKAIAVRKTAVAKKKIKPTKQLDQRYA